MPSTGKLFEKILLQIFQKAHWRKELA
jgi:hypothetical protein